MNLYGASGHAKVIIDIITSLDLAIDRVMDDNPEISSIAGFKVYQPNKGEITHGETILSIGKNEIRKKVAREFNGEFHPALIHSSAIISPSATLKKGTVVMANAVINASVKIGEHCIINTGAVVEHDCILGDFVHISPNAALAGDVVVGEGTHIGIGAVIIPGVQLGKWVTVGAGTVIIEDVPDGVVVVGNPGRIIKQKTH